MSWTFVAQVSSQAVADELDDAVQLFWSGQFAECIAKCEEGIDTGGSSEDLNELLMQAQLASGRYEDAARSLDSALISDRTSIRIGWLGHEICLLNGDSLRATELLIDLEENVRYRNWRYRDATNRVVQARFLMLVREDAKKILDDQLTPAILLAPNDARTWLAIADLALAKNDYAMAADKYRKVIEFQPGNPAGHMGLAHSFRPSDPDAANESLQRAFAIDPEHVPALLYLIEDRINSELHEEAELMIDRVLAVNPHNTDAWSFRAVLANLENAPQKEFDSRSKAFGKWAGNPRVDYLIGKKLSQKYRFSEGARHQRRALTAVAPILP